ncbi:Predicted multitransmembrane protein [Plesiocystis pacifica SIR-1]|uniref:Predicted multitransmembrane protein n=1 Tax=Plesiocystis pacifica SIR-1 TaxID=391625 RepID=A6GC22_9BACT|nr:S53 family serine peptidase [Plesiocystis pacifica]EDM76584.1 Predicted multitransmembrane protein [Plesiocystis pacifica SIR-1]
MSASASADEDGESDTAADEVGSTDTDPDEAGSSDSSTDEATEDTTDTTEESTEETTEESTEETTEGSTEETTTEDDTTDTETDTGGSPLDEIPEEEWEPVPNPDGVPQPLPGVYTDLGPADPNDSFRALMALDVRDREGLDAFLFDVSDPLSSIYGQYLTWDELVEHHLPEQDTVELLEAWLEFEGLSVNWVTTSGMYTHFSGLVGQFNEAFDTELRLCERTNPQIGQPPFIVYCTTDSMTLPAFVAGISPGVITCDLPAEEGSLPNEIGDIIADPPDNLSWGLHPERVANIYDVTPLYDMGYDGSGQAIAVMTGSRPHTKWMQTFWQSFGIVRPNPIVVEMLEPAVFRGIEATLNPAWAGAMAPGAEIIQYAAPDTRNTSSLWAFNEAMYRMPVDGAKVLTTSLAHREDAEPKLVRESYDVSAAIGSAQGLTLLSAGGNSGETDTPGSSPYMTAVGGTRVYSTNQGVVQDEVAWSESGSGETLSFPMPPWQVEVAGDLATNAMTVDLALAAAPFIGSAYWIYWVGDWELYGGTSFATPTFSGMAAVMNEYREDNGMEPLGFFNPKLYYSTQAQSQGFRDITTGATDDWAAGAGWDVPTGWGAPIVDELAQILP